MLAEVPRPMPALIPLHLEALLLAAMVCDGGLAADRPAARHLTVYYVWLSPGGVLGGGFTAMLAPVLFDAIVEYPMVLALLGLLVPTLNALPNRAFRFWLNTTSPLAVGVLVAAVVIELRGSGTAFGTASFTVSCVLLAAGAAAFARRPAAAALAGAALAGALVLFGGSSEPALHADRSFFGLSRVVPDAESGYHRLLHGSTLHGMQSLDPARRREPLTYYAASGPIGQVFAALHDVGSPERVGVVGLGTGSLACYQRPGQEWTFYEIDPTVERIARDPRYFTLLAECAPDAEVVLGDARLSLARAEDASYDLLILDAYSSDAIPVHLLTREALDLYLARLTEDGLLAFHISNRYLDLAPVLGALAEDAGVVGLVQADPASEEVEQARGKLASEWAVLARSEAELARLAADPRWQRLQAAPGVDVWTDDFSSLRSVLRWR